MLFLAIRVGEFLVQLLLCGFEFVLEAVECAQQDYELPFLYIVSTLSTGTSK